jgi:hypothetical protein
MCEVIQDGNNQTTDTAVHTIRMTNRLAIGVKQLKPALACAVFA